MKARDELDQLVNAYRKKLASIENELGKYLNEEIWVDAFSAYWEERPSLRKETIVLVEILLKKLFPNVPLM